jgi:hypothetical protein
MLRFHEIRRHLKQFTEWISTYVTAVARVSIFQPSWTVMGREEETKQMKYAWRTEINKHSKITKNLAVIS